MCNDLAKAYLEKAKTYSQEVIDLLYEKYWEELQKNLTSATAEQKTQPYPLYLNERKITNGIIDNSYLNNFGSQNSLESVFELQYDGTTMTNGTVNNYLSIYSNNTFTRVLWCCLTTCYLLLHRLIPKLVLVSQTSVCWRLAIILTQEQKSLFQSS